MAPAIVHFLVGASLLLLLAAPLAARYGTVRRHGITLATIGGTWGLSPDIHHVTPVYEGPIRAFHRSAWVDLFAFHYTLDRPPVRAYGPAESALPTVLVFLGVVAVFILASEWGDRGDFGPVELRREMIGGAAGGALVSTVLLGGVLHARGSMGAVAAVVGRESALAGWAVIGVGVVLAAGVFAVYIELVTRDVVTSPTSTAFGTLVAVPTWLVTIVLVVPLWKVRMFGTALEVWSVTPLAWARSCWPAARSERPTPPSPRRSRAAGRDATRVSDSRPSDRGAPFDDLERGHVVLAPDPFEPDDDATRPWVVVNNEHHPFDNRQYVVMGSTTRTWYDEPIPLERDDYRHRTAPRDSAIVPHAVASLWPVLMTDYVCRIRDGPLDRAVEIFTGYLRVGAPGRTSIEGGLPRRDI